MKPPLIMLRAGFTLVVVVLIHVSHMLAQGVNSADPIVRLGPDVWFVIAGGLVTVGINLEQLRRVRADMRDVKDANAKRESRIDLRHDENVSNFAKLDRRLERVEDTLDFLKMRRRPDRTIGATPESGQ